MTVHWTASKVAGELEASTYCTKAVAQDTSGEGVTACEELTEATGGGWVTEEETAQREAVLDADWEAQAAPQVISGTPW